MSTAESTNIITDEDRRRIDAQNSVTRMLRVDLDAADAKSTQAEADAAADPSPSTIAAAKAARIERDDAERAFLYAQSRACEMHYEALTAARQRASR